LAAAVIALPEASILFSEYFFDSYTALSNLDPAALDDEVALLAYLKRPEIAQAVSETVPFSSDTYLAEHPEIAASSQRPAVHCLNTGAPAGWRATTRTPADPSPAPSPRQLLESQRVHSISGTAGTDPVLARWRADILLLRASASLGNRGFCGDRPIGLHQRFFARCGLPIGRFQAAASTAMSLWRGSELALTSDLALSRTAATGAMSSAAQHHLPATISGLAQQSVVSFVTVVDDEQADIADCGSSLALMREATARILGEDSPRLEWIVVDLRPAGRPVLSDMVPAECDFCLHLRAPNASRQVSAWRWLTRAQNG
jgi:hypothetical protein